MLSCISRVPLLSLGRALPCTANEPSFLMPPRLGLYVIFGPFLSFTTGRSRRNGSFSRIAFRCFLLKGQFVLFKFLYFCPLPVLRTYLYCTVSRLPFLVLRPPLSGWAIISRRRHFCRPAFFPGLVRSCGLPQNNNWRVPPPTPPTSPLIDIRFPHWK